MKKVGILTFHYVDNYGAVLQAYALRKKINELPECRAEIINYVPSGFEYELYGNGEKYRAMLQKKRQSFEAFLSKYCGVNTPIISSVEDSGYDYYCVGSDQVWNSGYCNMDKAFFLQFGDKKRHPIDVQVAHRLWKGKDLQSERSLLGWEQILCVVVT